jgi:excinuclease ABC subunit C
MLDATGSVLYVGKARNLKKRVGSYFGRQHDSSKTRALVKQIQGIDVTVTHTEVEALLLENNLIKALKPRYNVIFRDDKSYPFLYLASDKDFPRLSYYRGSRTGKGRYFGPFPSSGSARRTLNLTQKLFQIRQCDDSFFNNRSRPCLQYQIKRCTAPCVGLISREDYHKDVEHAVMFLQGKNEEVISRLSGPMQQAAAALEFERAAKFRDQIANLRKVQENQYITARKGEIDIIACARKADTACIQLFFIRGGLILGNKAFYPTQSKGGLDADIVGAFLTQYYLANRVDRQIPPEILLSHTPADREMIEQGLSAQSGRRVKLHARLRGERARWIQMALENARVALQQRLSAGQNMQQRCEALAAVLGCEDTLERIECFDISHTGGENTVASCVVYNGAGPQKADYRRFNIENITPGDDYAAMRQVLERRYTRTQKEEGKLPDLILVDGGKGQLSVAAGVLQELQLEHIRLLGVAKGPSRKPGLESLILSDTRQTLYITHDSPALHLIQEIRDEAHRFAITGHRQRRRQQGNRSPLERIEGIGGKRRQQLISYFGGLQGIERAGVEDLAKVPGINKNLAQKIYNTFHQD